MSSFSSSISGITSAFFRQSVSSNNTANLNTSGFKASRVDQVESAGGGNRVAGTTRDTRQGPLIQTGRSRDLAIEGEGFFVLRQGDSQAFTRSGTFEFDGEGNLVDTSTGGIIQEQSVDGVEARIDDLQVDDSNRVQAPEATSEIQLSGNLDANMAVGETVQTSAELFTSNGDTQTALFEFEKTATNEFAVTVTDPETGDQALDGQLNFDGRGNLDQVIIQESPNAPGNVQGLFLSGSNGSDPIEVSSGDLDFSGVTQQAGNSSIQVSDLDGQTRGELESVSISEAGEVIASFNNGDRELIGTVALAEFNNPQALNSQGATLQESANSGPPRIGLPGEGNRGTIRSGFLEASNTDLVSEIVNQITNRADVEANVRMLQTRDEMLGELLDLAG